MKKQREARRKKAAADLARRAEDAKDAESRGGIESVDFLRKIGEYRRDHQLGNVAPWHAADGDIWGEEVAGAQTSSIRVCVRKRPMLKMELHQHAFDVVSTTPDHSSVIVHEPKTKVDLSKAVENHVFVFDAVFNESDGNAGIYESVLLPLLEHVSAGGSATVFAFGQTGSGKTCTMAGHGDHDAVDGNAVGLYALAANDVMGIAAQQGARVSMSFFEVYRGHVLDLLNERAKLEVLEDGKGKVQVVGLHEYAIGSADELMASIHQAEELRATGATSANEQSSRSHAILQVLLRDEADRQVGKLSLVDLAGSERAADSSSKDRQTRIEGAEINKSLLCLKECIRSLDTGSSHTPFRGSKLTQVLRDSFVGRAKTVMIATVSPGSTSAENTLNTLRYAQRVREFSNKRAPAAMRRLSSDPSARPVPASTHARPPPQQAPPTTEDSAEHDVASHALQGPEVVVTPSPPTAHVSLVAADEEAEAAAAAAAGEDEAMDQLGALGGGEEGGQGSSDGARVGGEEMANFFKSVAAVTRAEESLVGAHRKAVEEDEELIAHEKMLLEDIGDADGCSVDEYALALERVIGRKVALCMELQKKLGALKQHLQDEEALSSRVHHVPTY